MLSSSLFNNAVPKFTNGNYANNPIDPSYIEEIGMEDYNRGVEPLNTLPAQWWNWLCNQFTSRFNKLNTYVKNIFDEITQLLSLLNITPDGTESAITTGQLKNFFKELYPTYVSDKLELGTTYVHQTTRVNGHALSADVTVTKSDVGLGDVVNTGDSATPVENGTTKFTTGGAYTELNKKADLLDIASTFSTSTSYSVGDYVIYNGDLYRCVTAHSGSWTASHFTQVTVGDELSLKADKTSLAVPSDAVLHYSFDEIPDIPDGTAVARNLNGNTYNVSVSSVGAITTDAFTDDDKIHKSNVSGNANYKSDVSQSLTRGIYFSNTSGTGLIKIIEFDAKTSNLDVHIFYRQNESDSRTIIYPLGNTISIGKHKIVVFVPQDCFEYSIVFYAYASDLSYTEWELTGYYLGDGSYVTPIIDNVNGQNNGTNNGGIAVQGVSGKGAYLPSATQNALIPVTKIPAPNSNSSFTISLWIKFDTDYPMEEAATTGIVRVGQYQGLFGLCKRGSNIEFYARDSSVTRYVSTPIETGMWHNIVVVYNGTTHIATLYDNGSSKGITEPNIANFQFGSNETNWNIWGNAVISGSGDASVNKKATIDDLLIYDRALTDSEVMALYLNKANTPKYYTLNDYELSTGLDDVETRLDDVETELSGLETESVGTLRKFCGDIPSNYLDCSSIQRRGFGKIQSDISSRGNLFQLKDGSIYMCATHGESAATGLLKYNGSSFEKVAYTYNISYNYSITHLLQALDGTVYAVAGTKIFTTTDMVNFTNVNIQGLPDVTNNVYINTFVQTADGAFYVGILNKGLYRSTNGTSYSLISSSTTYCVLQATSGTYYAGMSGGLYKSTNGTSFSIMAIASIGTVDCIYQTKNGDIYAGSASSNGKLYKSTDGTTFSEVSSVPSYGISGIVQEDDGSIYVATGNFVSGNTNNVSILVSTDGTNFTSIATFANTSSEEVYPMLKAKDGSIFLYSVAFGIVKSTKWGVVSKTDYPTLYSVVGDRYANNVVSLESTDFVIPLEEDSSFNCGIQI